jgi:hypothetical protein
VVGKRTIREHIHRSVKIKQEKEDIPHLVFSSPKQNPSRVRRDRSVEDIRVLIRVFHTTINR